jgi:hypothetical protein
VFEGDYLCFLFLFSRLVHFGGFFLCLLFFLAFFAVFALFYGVSFRSLIRGGGFATSFFFFDACALFLLRALCGVWGV